MPAPYPNNQSRLDAFVELKIQVEHMKEDVNVYYEDPAAKAEKFNYYDLKVRINAQLEAINKQISVYLRDQSIKAKIAEK